MLSPHCDCELITCPAINSKIRFKGSHRPTQRLCKEPFRAHNRLAKAMITRSHNHTRPCHAYTLLGSKVKSSACACNLIKSKMASVRGYSEMSQYAPRPPEGVWGFVNSKCCYELVEEAGRMVQRVWLRCSGGLRGVLDLLDLELNQKFVTCLKLELWYRQVSVSVKILSFYFTLCRCGDTQHH